MSVSTITGDIFTIKEVPPTKGHRSDDLQARSGEESRGLKSGQEVTVFAWGH